MAELNSTSKEISLPLKPRHTNPDFVLSLLELLCIPSLLLNSPTSNGSFFFVMFDLVFCLLFKIMSSSNAPTSFHSNFLIAMIIPLNLPICSSGPTMAAEVPISIWTPCSGGLNKTTGPFAPFYALFLSGNFHFPCYPPESAVQLKSDKSPRIPTFCLLIQILGQILRILTSRIPDR